LSRDKERRKIEKIRDSILKSGYLLELEIRNFLKKSNWFVSHQWAYIDKTTGKVRLIDIVARKVTKRLNSILLIECKKSDKHEWAFYTEPKEIKFLDTYLKMLGDFYIKFENLLKQQSNLNLSKLNRLHLMDKTIKLGVLHRVISSKKDDFYEAAQQIISALEDLENFAKIDSDELSIFFPTIVFDGYMYEFYQENKETKVFPINHVQFISFRRDATPCVIDVVRKTYFPEFLKILEKDFQILIEFINRKGQV